MTGRDAPWGAPELKVELVGLGPPGPAGTTPHIGKNGNWWSGEEDTGVNASGAVDHPRLTNRDAPGQHPMAAIDGLEAVLKTIPSPLSADELRKILME